MKLGVMFGQTLDFFLAFTTQGIAYRSQYFHNHTLHDVMTLDKHVGILRSYPQISELSLHHFNFFNSPWMFSFQFVEFVLHTPVHTQQGLLRMMNADMIQTDIRAKVEQREFAQIALAIKPHRPYKEWIGYLGIHGHESDKIDQWMIIQGSHHAGFVQPLSIALIVFNGIRISLEDIPALIDLTGSGGYSL